MGFGTYTPPAVSRPRSPVRYYYNGKRHPTESIPYLPTFHPCPRGLPPLSLQLRRIETLLKVTFIPLPCTPS